MQKTTMEPGALEGDLLTVGATLPDTASRLRGHIAALERHVTGLEKSLENARKEREELRLEATEALRAMICVVEVLTDNDKEPVIDAARRVVTERDAALADNAALVKKMRAAGDALHCGGYVDLSTGGEHPGAALLEELVRLRECARLAAEHGASCALERLAERDEHRKALVRARNEGREQAATGVGHTPPCGPGAVCAGCMLARGIRALKEDES